LPAGWRDWEAPVRDAALTHELAHIARRDVLTQRLSLLYRAIFWFSPLSWWLRRRLADLAEEASDEVVSPLAPTARRTRKAARILRGMKNARDAPLAGRGDGTWSSARRRVQHILAWERPSPATRTWLIASIVAVTTPIGLLAATVTPGRTHCRCQGWATGHDIAARATDTDRTARWAGAEPHHPAANGRQASVGFAK
jgi:beta-lactamase regulating signal transducer with metallopeptidase domain